jgi:hypothetical protein
MDSFQGLYSTNQGQGLVTFTQHCCDYKVVFSGVYRREWSLWFAYDLGVSWQAYDLGEP